MKVPCTHYMGVCDHLVCPREVEAAKAEAKAMDEALAKALETATVYCSWCDLTEEACWARRNGTTCPEYFEPESGSKYDCECGC